MGVTDPCRIKRAVAERKRSIAPPGAGAGRGVKGDGVKRSLSKKKEEARRLYLAGEVSSNAEIAVRLKVKPHTVARWRKLEDWDGLRLKIDRRAAEMLVEKLATDRVSLNVRHYRLWELVLAKLMEDLKAKGTIDTREMERISGVLDRAQKGQRLAKGLSITGESEEQIRAQSQMEIRKLIDAFIDAVKDNVGDETTRERIRQALFSSLPPEPETEDSNIN
jgi:hypothetical protein